MNYKYVLDSYAWSEFFDGFKEGLIVKDLLDQGNVATSVVALAELSDKCAREQRDVQLLVRFIQIKEGVLFLKEPEKNGRENNNEE